MPNWNLATVVFWWVVYVGELRQPAIQHVTWFEITNICVIIKGRCSVYHNKL